MRQFYDIPRQFRITGAMGVESFVSYDNSALKGKEELGIFTMPIFDIKVSAQRKNIYTKVQQNELALELYQNGCFNPDLADQAMLLLETMDFDGKEKIMRRVSENGGLNGKADSYRQLALIMAKQYEPEIYERLTRKSTASAPRITRKGRKSKLGESAVTLKARKRANQTTMPR